MLVRHEDVPEPRQGDAGEDELARHAVAAVDDIGAARSETMTWAEAELAFRGRGPPPVPRRMSLVAAAAPGSVVERSRGQQRRRAR